MKDERLFPLQGHWVSKYLLKNSLLTHDSVVTVTLKQKFGMLVLTGKIVFSFRKKYFKKLIFFIVYISLRSACSFSFLLE
jgi:hypothetical protein